MASARAGILRVDPSTFRWIDSTGAAAGVRRVIEAAAHVDGRSPLNEQALLSLQHSGLENSDLWTAELDGDVVGFALASLPRPGARAAPVEADLVVAPRSRGRGIGAALADAALGVLADARVSAWSHGNHPGAAALAAALGFDRIRDLWLMRRSLSGLPDVQLPADIVVRAFDPARDPDAFLEVNAKAFAHHPEQGGITRADLDQRIASPWFDPEGFLLAESSTGALLGFHWTKVHREDPPYGEVYVVGVAPDAQGTGLGKVLTLAGLHHLRSRGLDEVILYVESDNAPAVAVYEQLGFTHADEDTDVIYAR